jgi:hypothetical protein
MKNVDAGSLVHRVLIASAGAVCLFGFLVLATANVHADGGACLNGDYCEVGGAGTCNLNVDTKTCCCMQVGGKSCSPDDNCKSPAGA